MRELSVAEAAGRLGVTPHRVRQRIEDGTLPAVRVGNRWSIDEADLLPLMSGTKTGRPVSERSAWAILDLAEVQARDTSTPPHLAASERSRARQRLNHLLTRVEAHDDPGVVAQLLRELLGNRAQRHLFQANDRDLDDLRADARLAPSGLSDPRAGIASGDIVEGYVLAGRFEELVRDYLLVPAVNQAARQRANVVLHASDRPVTAPVPPLLLAADLAEHRGPREESRARELLTELEVAP
jgi:excisionase family DNA binding protein